ncbi:hypothetical protein CEXT_78571 [Caerostris extrusa]|uniref:Uncharacterized protein n=1 Tax=Caerostris extrusa TaxID=172846 RepID=A0AAV4MA20_CAEEX|nr:hypothetical protein CEXT_78571 [Caerostris extrusa]
MNYSGALKRTKKSAIEFAHFQSKVVTWRARVINRYRQKKRRKTSFYECPSVPQKHFEMTYCDQERRSFIEKGLPCIYAPIAYFFVIYQSGRARFFCKYSSFQKFLGREEKNTWKSFYGSQASNVLEETEYTLRHTGIV